MGVYSTIESVINEMAFEMSKNQTLMKYLVYDDVTADPLSLPDLTDTQKYIYKSYEPDFREDYRIFPLPKIPYMVEEKKTMICCYYRKSNALMDPYNRDFEFVFDVITHLDIWQIKGGIIRPLRIMDEINNMFFMKKTPNSIGKMTNEEDSITTFDSQGLFMGYRLIFEGNDFTRSLCGPYVG